jgi:hypothetical protein
LMTRNYDVWRPAKRVIHVAGCNHAKAKEKPDQYKRYCCPGDLELSVPSRLVGLGTISAPVSDQYVKERKSDHCENEPTNVHTGVPKPQELSCFWRCGIKYANVHLALAPATPRHLRI